MEHKDVGFVIVSGITLRAMHQISFTSLMKLTLEADTGIRSLHLYMRQLCIAIIRNLYNFEDPTDQDRKLKEVYSLRQNIQPGQLSGF